MLGLLFAPRPPLQAVDIALSSAAVRAGDTVAIHVTVSDAPANTVSAFAFYVVHNPALGLPVVTPGSSQPNLTCFIDDFGNGVYRVTGFVLSEPAVTNGHIATLAYTVPLAMSPAVYPLAFTGSPPPNAPLGVNPETRALISSALIEGAGLGGAIIVATVPLITSIVREPGNTFRITFTGTPGYHHTVEASTNLTVWAPLTNLLADGFGLFGFVETDAGNYPQRFFRAVFP